MAEMRASARIITPPGEGGIGIIALSGPDAARVLDAAFSGTRRPASALSEGAIAHGTIRREEHVLDEVIVARVGEGFEVNCHGGIVAARAVLDRLREAGAQVAEGGEGEDGPPMPLDPSWVRALALDLLPGAPTRLSAAMLLHQADGALANAIEAVARALAAENDEEALLRLDGLLGTVEFGRALLSPVRVALLGPPNAGKSTLLNALLEEERAIVHEEPGTTRDVVSQTLSLRGVPFEVMDAAGIRASADDVERLAVDRATALAADCEVALLVYDAREDPRRALADVPPPCAGARAILVANKTDLLPAPPSVPAALPHLEHAPFVAISAKLKRNIEGLEEELLSPYVDMIEPARQGAPVVFDGRIGSALRGARRLLASGSRGGALQALCAAGRG